MDLPNFTREAALESTDAEVLDSIPVSMFPVVVIFSSYTLEPIYNSRQSTWIIN